MGFLHQESWNLKGVGNCLKEFKVPIARGKINSNTKFDFPFSGPRKSYGISNEFVLTVFSKPDVQKGWKQVDSSIAADTSMLLVSRSYSIAGVLSTREGKAAWASIMLENMHSFLRTVQGNLGVALEHPQNRPVLVAFLCHCSDRISDPTYALFPHIPDLNQDALTAEILRTRKAFLIHTQLTSAPTSLEKCSNYPEMWCLECFIALAKWNVYIKIRRAVRCHVLRRYYGHPGYGYDIIQSQSEVVRRPASNHYS